MNPITLLVTGGCGFIGSNFVRYALTKRPNWRLINLDALTYAGNPHNLDNLNEEQQTRYQFIQADIRSIDQMKQIYEQSQIDAVVHFAAESHVDRSIHNPSAFVETNIIGTHNLLEAARQNWEKRKKPYEFRFLHVSTDEVYGSLGSDGFFTETTAYDPSSPYSASKAGSDHLANAWHRTYGLPVLITNCSNNYGPYQFPEKLIPLMILNILEKKSLPIYGDGKNVRDWLYVLDHCDALLTVLEKGLPGETYNIGGNEERQNIDIVHLLCDILDLKWNRKGPQSSRNLIKFVTDRPGHDRRYAIDASKIKHDLGWEPKYTFESAIEETIDWYLNNTQWVKTIRNGDYLNWINQNYSERSIEK